MKAERIGRYKELGPLHDLLLEACPPDAKGTRSIVVLAKLLGVTPQYIYVWIERNHVPAKFVRPLVEMSRGRVRLEQFHEYAFR